MIGQMALQHSTLVAAAVALGGLSAAAGQQRQTALGQFSLSCSEILGWHRPANAASLPLSTCNLLPSPRTEFE